MPHTDPAPDVALPQRTYSPVAALLSYLVPGLGQVYQGRVGKGLLFLVCLYGLFFYGLSLGHWQNVYVQPMSTGQRGQPPRVFELFLERARFLGQMWIGVAAWPAIWQYAGYNAGEDRHPYLGTFERMPDEAELNNLLRNSDKAPDLGWMYTVVAGVLNILVIYDAFAGPAVLPAVRRQGQPSAPTQEVALS